jgi:hypothetical protein
MPEIVVEGGGVLAVISQLLHEREEGTDAERLTSSLPYKE